VLNTHRGGVQNVYNEELEIWLIVVGKKLSFNFLPESTDGCFESIIEFKKIDFRFIFFARHQYISNSTSLMLAD
jgi:hypothetical protein